MDRFPAPSGLAVTAGDGAAARRFYADLCPPERVAEGVFAGIPYVALMRGGQALVTIFARVAGGPLAGILPALTVDSVAACEEQVRELGGDVLIAAATGPAAGAPAAVCLDPDGNQFMITEARSPP